MATENDVGSLVLEHSPHQHQFRLWNSFSAASFRRRLIAAVSCGGASSSKSLRKHKKPEPIPAINPPDKNVSESGRSGSEKLIDLLNLSHSTPSAAADAGVAAEDVEEVKRKEGRLEELRAAVRKLQSKEVKERINGAKLVRRLAKEDGDARSTLAMLGAIPPLIGMLDHDGDDDDGDGDERDSQMEALYALLNLGIGNDLNKAAIVQAGAVHKMLKTIESSNESQRSTLSEAIVANFLALSALDSNKTIIGASGAITFLVSFLEKSDTNNCSSQARQDTVKALYNLSISPSNIPSILETNSTHLLVNMLGNMEVSERILSILTNVVSTSEGRKAISIIPDVFPTLIDVLSWTDSPGCQEKASYVLMVMAHKSYSYRQTMVQAGIGSALLELTLLGTTLAQKRASRLLEFLRVDKGKQVSQGYNGHASAPAVSAPIYGSSSSSMSNVNKEGEGMMSEEKKAVKQLVQQSLQNNMKRIVKRANLPQDFVPSEHLKSLTASSTSKSLPF